MSNRHREIALTEPEVKRELGRKSRRGFLVGAAASAAGFGLYEWASNAKEEDGVPWPQRRTLEVNGRLAHDYVSDARLMPTFPPDRVGHLKANGNIGMEDPLDRKKWNLELSTSENAKPLRLTLADVKAVAKVEMITQFCCIEGWSNVAHWGGAKFSDFTRKYFPPGEKLPNYVYMATAGEDYYVGLDIKSAMHPQTLLAYEQNGEPLKNDHGAPLRLVIPTKYGIKNIKRIALIRYTDTKPADYWAEEGYDWFAGL